MTLRETLLGTGLAIGASQKKKGPSHLAVPHRGVRSIVIIIGLGEERRKKIRMFWDCGKCKTQASSCETKVQNIDSTFAQRIPSKGVVFVFHG